MSSNSNSKSNELSAPLPPPSPTYIYREHKATVNYVHLFDNDKHLATCDADGWIVVWKMRTKRPILKWKAHEDNCMKVTTIKMNRLISQGRDNLICIWELPSLEENIEPKSITSIVYNALGFCKFSYCIQEDLELICFPSMDNIEFFDIYDLTNQKFVYQNTKSGAGENSSPRFGSCMVVQLFKISTSLFVLSGYESGHVVLWEIDSNSNKPKLVWDKQEHKEPVLDLSTDNTNSFVISSSADNQICKYSLGTGETIKKITVKKAGLVTLSIRSDNKIFALGGYDGKIRVFSVKSMKPLAILSYHREAVYSIVFGSEENWLIGGSQDNRISLWNIY